MIRRRLWRTKHDTATTGRVWRSGVPAQIPTVREVSKTAAEVVQRQRTVGWFDDLKPQMTAEEVVHAASERSMTTHAMPGRAIGRTTEPPPPPPPPMTVGTSAPVDRAASSSSLGHASDQRTGRMKRNAENAATRATQE